MFTESQWQTLENKSIKSKDMEREGNKEEKKIRTHFTFMSPSPDFGVDVVTLLNGLSLLRFDFFFFLLHCYL